MRHTQHIAMRILPALFLLCLLALPVAAKQAKSPPDWLEEYWKDGVCLKIHNLREGPTGFYLIFNFIAPDGKTMGEEMQLAPLDDDDPHKAEYSILGFTLSKDGKSIQVTRVPDMQIPPEDSAWIDKVSGTYTRK